MDKILIEKGDFINNIEIIGIYKNPYIKGETLIFVEAYEIDCDENKNIIQYKIKKGEKNK